MHEARSETSPSLAHRTLSALKWNYAGAAVRAGCSLVIGIILARLLGPVPFGMVAVAWLVIGLGNLVADFGLGAALVQRANITDRDIRYVFTIQIILGLFLTTIIVIIAPAVAALFHQPNLVAVIRWLSLIFLVQGFGLTSVALLKRELNFRLLQIAEISSYLVGFVIVGIPLALGGAGVWALVIAQLCQTTLLASIAYATVRHTVLPAWSGTSQGLNVFGSKVLFNNIVNWTIANIDTFFAGRILGIASLGLYDRASSLLTTPATNLSASLQKVIFPAYSRAQNNPESIRRCHLASVGFITLISLPVYGCVALVPHAIIGTLLGAKWAAAVALIVPIALAMPFQVATAMGGPMLCASGRPGRELRAQAWTAVLAVIILFITALISIQAMAWGVLAVAVARFILVTSTALKLTGANWPTLLHSMRGGAILLLCAAIALISTDRMTQGSLPIDILACAGAVFIAIVAVPGTLLSPEMKWLIGEVAPILPIRIQTLIERVRLPEGALT